MGEEVEQGKQRPASRSDSGGIVSTVPVPVG